MYLTPTENRYSTTEKKGLACVWACERLHSYVHGRKFLLQTNHRALTTLFSSSETGSVHYAYIVGVIDCYSILLR